MKVFYDHQIFFSQIYGGISRYFYELMNQFYRDKEVEFYLSLKYSNNAYIENVPFSCHRSFFKDYNFKGKYRIMRIINTQWSKFNLFTKDFDIFHPTYYDPYFLKYIDNKPFILTIYDMIHELFSDRISQKDKTSKRKKLLAQKATKIIAISENTKKDIIKFYEIDEEKIKVIYLGNSFGIHFNKENYNIRLPERYLLFVGSRGSYKNFDAFIKAIIPFLHEDRNLSVVCVGGGKFSADEIMGFESLNISNRFYYYSVNDEILSYLYKKAIAFVFPSLYEGFGIPILEAFACGCPVVVSNTSSLPEVAGDAAIYFDPKDESSMREGILKVIYDNELRDKLKTKGFNQLKNFSWEKTAQETKALYMSVL